MEIKGYKPHEMQKQIHDVINNGNHKYYVLVIGRQWGKTLFAINQCLNWAINDKGCNIGWVSPVYKQCKKVFSTIENATNKSGIFTYNKSELDFNVLGSKFSMYSGERPDNIRGNTFDYLIVDEAAYQKPNLWSEVLQPATLVKGKKVIFISTPRGKNDFYVLANNHINSDSWYTINLPTFTNPYISKDDLDDIRQQIPEHIYRQEYLAEFIDNISSVFGNFKECITNPIADGSRCFGGLDIGRADDYTVLTILNKSGQQVFSKRWRQMEWANIVNEVSIEINKYKAETLIEVNNQGDIFFDLLKVKCGNLIHPFTTTSKSKAEIIELLIVALQEKDLKLKDIDYQNVELEAFTYVYDNKSRSVKYGAPSGMHDDSVISLALANQSRKENKNSGNYTIVRVRF